jgi:hypothetical protein
MLLMMKLSDLKRAYQPACLERILEWTSGVRRHGCGRSSDALFEEAIRLKTKTGLSSLE